MPILGTMVRLGLSAIVSAIVCSGVSLATTPCADCHDPEDRPRFEASVHGFMDCADCHTSAGELPHPEPAGEVDCSTCHEEATAAVASSVHAPGSGETNGPASCARCHGDIHAVVPQGDPDSPVHRARLPETCGHCHAKAGPRRPGVVLPVEAYSASVHARLVAAGDAAAGCSDCHASHAIFAVADPRSTVFHRTVPQTCGQCHERIAASFAGSVHGEAAARGVREAPVCTDCHGEHRILGPDEPGSPVYPTNVPLLTCGRCHGDLRLSEKFGIAAGKVPAYQDSYHGLAARTGVTTVAHCGSCHGVHDIRPSSDPASHVHPDRLAATCGSCHPGAGQRFAIGAVHVLPNEREHTAVYWVRWIYLWIIYGTIGAMVLHNLLDLLRKARSPRHEPPQPANLAAVRMTPAFRATHGLLIASFAVLVPTGFALTYPESWWAAPFLRWEANFGLRGGLHRAAAIAMLAALVLHLVHLVVDRRARACMLRMRPTAHDLRELRDRVAWFLGRRATPPLTGSLGYAEKAEYLALWWGLIVMALTGFVLWFEGPALRWLPKWAIDVATVIHFYEAVLASLAIVVWHLYFVIFDPVVYPMDTAWLTGRSAPGRAAERSADEPP